MTNEEWFQAIDEANIEKVKTMIKNGFDLNITTHSSRNALHCIGNFWHNEREKLYQITKLLIKHNINIDQKDMYNVTPLLEPVIITFYPEITELLIDSGANIHQEDSRGHNIFVFAICTHNEKLVQKLLELGMDINYINKKGQTITEIVRDQTLKYKTFRHLMRYEHLLCQKQKDIIEKEKLRMLFH